MIVGCYSIDLYCDNYDEIHWKGRDDHGHEWREFPHTYTGKTRGECIAQARKHGWLVNDRLEDDGGRQLCPKCSGKRR